MNLLTEAFFSKINFLIKLTVKYITVTPIKKILFYT